ISMMAIDYNDPGVMEEFNAIQLMEYDDVVAELALSGVRAPVDMGDMDVKLMLVELRTFGSRFEECLWTKPAFRSLYEGLKSFGDHNRMNVAAEYCNEPEGAKMRYMSSYGPFLDEIEMALNARPEVSTPTVRFGGFPANMGEFGLRMTLEALGGIVDMTVEVSDDGITLLGGHVRERRGGEDGHRAVRWHGHGDGRYVEDGVHMKKWGGGRKTTNGGMRGMENGEWIWSDEKRSCAC
ncbi:hypothetical protein ACHAXA_006675, partial [Cyclostephanos tholiformis]